MKAVSVSRKTEVEFEITCDLCSTTGRVTTTNKRHLSVAAGSLGWLSVGQGGHDGWVCPAHEVPCPHCTHPASTWTLIASRARIQKRGSR